MPLQNIVLQWGLKRHLEIHVNLNWKKISVIYAYYYK